MTERKSGGASPWAAAGRQGQQNHRFDDSIVGHPPTVPSRVQRLASLPWLDSWKQQLKAENKSEHTVRSYLISAMGLASVTFFNTFFYIGLKSTTAIQGSLIQSILPVLVLILVVTVLSERINGLQVMGVVLSILGAAIILMRGDPEVALSLQLNIGDLWCLAAVFFWAIQLMLLRWKPPQIAMPEFMTVLIAWGVVLMIPGLIWEISTGQKLVLNSTNLMFLAYVAVVASVFGTTLFNSGVIRVGPATSGYFGNLYPVFAAVLAVLLLGEKFEWFHGLGGALVLGGIYFATMARRKTQ